MFRIYYASMKRDIPLCSCIMHAIIYYASMKRDIQYITEGHYDLTEDI